MQDFAVAFYKSKTWQKCRNEYAKSKRHLCERCLADGVFKSGEIVHHRIHLTPDNIDDPNITLSFDNLELVCREHHAEIHSGKVIRYKVDELGHIITIK